MNDFDQFGKDLERAVDQVSDLGPIAAGIRSILLTSIDRNFSEGGRYGTDNVFGGGSHHWKSSGRAQSDAGQTLVDTGQLVASTVVEVSGNVISIGTNKVYGRIHHLGGKAGRGHAVTIEPRPIYVVQNEDLEDITLLLVEYYARRFGK